MVLSFKAGLHQQNQPNLTAVDTDQRDLILPQFQCKRIHN